MVIGHGWLMGYRRALLQGREREAVLALHVSGAVTADVAAEAIGIGKRQLYREVQAGFSWDEAHAVHGRRLVERALTRIRRQADGVSKADGR